MDDQGEFVPMTVEEFLAYPVNPKGSLVPVQRWVCAVTTEIDEETDGCGKSVTHPIDGILLVHVKDGTSTGSILHQACQPLGLAILAGLRKGKGVNQHDEAE